MENHDNSPNKRQRQDTKFKADLIKVYNAAKSKPMTTKEADIFAGVMRESICRHIDTLLRQGIIAVIRKRKYTITGYPYVNEYTADTSLLPKSNQLNLFSHD